MEMTADAIRDDTASLVRQAVAAMGDGSIKAGVARAARAYGLSARRVRGYLHREVRNPLAWEVAAIRARTRALIAVQRERADAALRDLERHLEAFGDGL
jgi:hypothetical protein